MEKCFQNIEIPVIPKNTKIKCRPFLLLRQKEDTETYYDIDSIIERVIEGETTDNEYKKNFKFYLLCEIAANSKLRQQLSLNLNFNEFLNQASKIEIVD